MKRASWPVAKEVTSFTSLTYTVNCLLEPGRSPVPWPFAAHPAQEEEGNLTFVEHIIRARLWAGYLLCL